MPAPYRVSIAAEPLSRRHHLSQRWVREVVRFALALEGAPPRGRVEVLLAGDRTVRRLNASFLGEDHVTDVLSFPNPEDRDFPRRGPWREIGQVALSVPQAARQARESARSLEEEVAHLLVHGVLHLLGYDHAEGAESAAMRAREERILATWTAHPIHAGAGG